MGDRERDQQTPLSNQNEICANMTKDFINQINSSL